LWDNKKKPFLKNSRKSNPLKHINSNRKNNEHNQEQTKATCRRSGEKTFKPLKNGVTTATRVDYPSN